MVFLLKSPVDELAALCSNELDELGFGPKPTGTILA